MTPAVGLTVAVALADEPLSEWRTLAACDEGLAWVVVRPAGGRDLLPTFARDLVHATGAVGLRTPRANGERFLHRGLAHLVGGRFSDLVVRDAELLGEELLEEVTLACHAVGVRVWLLMDAGVPTTEVIDYLADAGVPSWSFADLVDAWEERLAGSSARAALCTNTRPWRDAAAQWASWTAGCPVHHTRIGCLLRAMRRDLTSGAAGAAEVREVAMALPQPKATTALDLWELSQVAYELWTLTESALLHMLPSAVPAAIDVCALDAAAASLDVDGRQVPVPTALRPLLARQAAFSRLTHGPGDWPLLTLHDGSC